MQVFRRTKLIVLASALGLGLLQAQEPATFPRNGTYDEREGHYAFTNARILVAPGRVIEKGNLVIKQGKIVAVGPTVPLPKDAVVFDLQGKHIYPGLIDLYAEYGLPAASAAGKSPDVYPQMLSNKAGAYHWNEALKPEFEAAAVFRPVKKEAEERRKQGFGLVLSQQMDGVARGSSALVFLGDGPAHRQILRDKAAAHYSFSKGVSTQAYPSSLMGVIALLRQTYYDAAWYKRNTPGREYNISLEKWLDLQKLPQIFEANHRLNILRADKIGDEFGVQYIFKTGGDEYLRLEAIQQSKGALIVPLNFPKAYDLTDPLEALHVNLDQMQHWELAPSNAARLAQAGINFAFTAHGLEKAEEFWPALRRAYQHGLSEEAMWKALTLAPAQILGVDKEIGSLEPGKWANFFIASGNPLSDKALIYHNWIAGQGYELEELLAHDLRGTYELNLGSEQFTIESKGDLGKPDMKIRRSNEDSTKNQKLNFTHKLNTLTLHFELADPDTTKKTKLAYKLSGRSGDNTWEGRGQNAQGQWLDWTAKQTKAPENKTLELPKPDSTVKGEIRFPASAYGYTAEQAPKQGTVLFRQATVWTGEAEGILEETDVLIEMGRISQIGKNLKAPPTAKIIEAKGKHLSAGIIDEHSHIAINAGVNEGTQSSTAEVRIGDVVTSEDINIYRQLAGGVTMAQLLHGSANAIGGQSAIIKLRWGKLPEEMKMQEAKGYIKFALGENVKQSNWGDQSRIRFPQTRMGVEQVYEDFFTRAREYGERRKLRGEDERRDLDLEAILEILEGKRFITCHSYVQSEITMLMRVAERHNFRVNTFTHILEGYKIADKMKAHGVGASSFSDWWAYKFEVLDAIPGNAIILDKMGVVTALNSDDAEMGRRLNQEAAKMLKYGDIEPQKALNMVTLNPAKLLRIDDKVGSIKVGKQADLVLWSHSPLSIYAKAEKTFVDGICYFDLELDKQLRQNIQAERQRLSQKLLEAKAKGEKTQPVSHTHGAHYHCDTQYDAVRN